ncbi:MAG TPA: amino acid adenylation domain-containing protein [Paucimonas sp.]|nr:amino acid adenylation domain-containing protein [Paucimonas sp.]
MQQTDIEGFRPSVQQAQLWQNVLPEAHAVLRADIDEAIDPARLRQALESAVIRHEILRTRLHTMPGMQMPVQVIEEQAVFDWREADAMMLSAPEAETQEAAILADMRAGVSRPGKPAFAAVVAAALIQHAPKRFRLLLVASPVNADARAMRLLLREVEQGCRQESAPDADCVQYADFAEWQHEFLASVESDAGRAFWRRQVDPALLKLKHPFERRGAVAGGFACASRTRSTDARWTDRLLTAAAAVEATPTAILSICWSVLLQRQLGLSTVMLGWRHDGRNDATQTAIGPYAKTLPLLSRQNEDATIKTLAHAQDALLAEAAMCQESFSPAEFAAGAGVSHLPYVFEYRAASAGRDAWRITDVEATGEPFALWLAVGEPEHDAAGSENSVIALTLRYDAARFTAQSVELLLDQFVTLAEQACRRIDAPLRSLSALSEEQGARLAALNRTEGGYVAPDLLHALFEGQAAKRPQAVAVEFGAQRLTYAELNTRANRLAHRLRREGIVPDAPVGLYVGRSAEAVIGMLGILKAGGAYLPLDPTYPTERLAFMLEDTAASLVLTVAPHAATLPRSRAAVLLLDDDATYAGCMTGRDMENPVPVNPPDSLAYIIFTSGSTGQPKGVMVSHRHAIHSTMARWHHYDVECESFLLSSSFAFDSSVAGLFWTLSQGGRLCLPGDDAVQDAEAMGRLIETHRATHVLMLSSFYGQLLETQPASRLASLKCVIVAGEACMATTAARHRAVCPEARLYNEYGPTEGAVWCTFYESGTEDEEQCGVLPIGGPIVNMRVYVLDKQLAQVSQGVAGEIYIGGTGIARGYLRRPALTAERFVPDPFGPPGGRLYRTGDIGRFDAAGCLEFLGRVDHQVKIRGFRIELGEIEARLAEYPAVREAAVVARADKNGDMRLIAYLVARGACPAIPLLQQHLKQHLPDHMVPAAFVALDALPLTPNGKLDRKALPEPEQYSRPAYIAPRSEAEILLAQIWSEVLDADRTGIDDDFFALGGHSLVATKLVSRVRSLMGRDAAVRSVFQHPRLADFARHVLEQAADDALPLTAVPRNQPLPLSFSQQRMWRFDREHPHSIVYNVPSAVRLFGELDRGAMQRAFDELVRRHEALRTTFAFDEAAGMPVQMIHPAGPVALLVIDLADLDTAAREAGVLRFLSAEEHTPFDLARGPLMRAGLIRESEREHVLWITLHHIVSDRWSMQVLVRELSILYEAFSSGKPSPLAEPTIQYADFAVWQRRHVQGEVLQRQLDFWKAQLRADQPPLQLPGMRQRPARQSHRGDTYRFDIERDLAQRIHALCRSQGATLFMTMLAAFKALLAIRSNERDVPVGILLANRNRLELEGLTGCLINMLALRADAEQDLAFAAYLERVRETVLAAQSNQDVPFECVVEAVQPQSVPGCSPLFQVLFDVHRDRILQQPAMGGLTFADAPEPPSPTTHFDLMVGIGEREDGLRASIVYCTDLFDETLIARLARDYVRVLEVVTAAPETTIAKLAMEVAPAIARTGT